MRRTLLLIGLVALFLSQKAVSQKFVQSESIQLAQPQLQVSNNIIDQEEKIYLVEGEPGIEVFYTLNGKEPTRSSAKYNGPIQVLEPGQYKFKAFHKNFQSSEVAEVMMYKMGHQVDSIVWISDIGAKYPGVGKKTLINHKKAGVNFSDPQWMGFDNPVEMILMFRSEKHIKSIDIGYLADPASWIFPPEEVVISISENLKDFTEIQTLVFDDLTAMVSAKTATHSMVFERKAKALKIEIKNLDGIPEWHEGKGAKAWMFLDELIFYE